MSQLNIQKLMDRWVNDPEFRKAMREDAEGAIRRAGITLSPTEKAALQQVNWDLSDEALNPRSSKL
jgi:hypothetical protein